MSRPFASAAFDGMTTFRPGTALYQASKFCECCAPFGPPAPHIVRIVSGSDVAGEVAELRRLVDDLVHRDHREVEEHDLDDRAQADGAAADAEPDEHRLADRRVAHAHVAERSSSPRVTP